MFHTTLVSYKMRMLIFLIVFILLSVCDKVINDGD